MRNLTTVALLFVLGLLATGRLSYAEDKPMVEKVSVTVQVGDPAPAFKGTDDRGQTWDSAEYLGKNYTVIYFYPADDAKQVLEFIQQDKAANEISTRGGKLEFEEQNSIRWVVSVDLPGCRFKDEDTLLLASLPRVRTVVLGGNVKDSGLVFVTGLRNLESLTIDSPHIKGSGLANLAGLPKLRSLNVEGSDVNDDALLPLKGCKQLKELNLGMTLITDRGLEYLKEMTNLESLNLDDQYKPLTDEGIAQLKGLTRLKTLNLSSSKLSDAGLECLKSLTSLETLSIEATNVTDDGVADFQKALPQVTVIR